MTEGLAFDTDVASEICLYHTGEAYLRKLSQRQPSGTAICSCSGASIDVKQTQNEGHRDRDEPQHETHEAESSDGGDQFTPIPPDVDPGPVEEIGTIGLGLLL